eukprot:819272-Amphidinium_carterae.2
MLAACNTCYRDLATPAAIKLRDSVEQLAILRSISPNMYCGVASLPRSCCALMRARFIYGDRMHLPQYRDPNVLLSYLEGVRSLPCKLVDNHTRPKHEFGAVPRKPTTRWPSSSTSIGAGCAAVLDGPDGCLVACTSPHVVHLACGAKLEPKVKL